ncbi:MAG: EF-hand domain-containing protein [Pirellulales bacterium]|nr:EF-hand domain-containing protein [Pirellulales bacterium]
MKYTYLLFTLACAAIVSLAATTFAAPPENNDPAARKAEMLKKFDKDGDGKLSDTEKTTLRAEMQNRRGGGRDRKQWTPEQRDEMLKKFDTDGDGKLSQEERDTAREAMKASRTKGEKQQKKKD